MLHKLRNTEEAAMRAIVLLGRFWGANLTLGDEAPGIVAQLAGFGWELTFASAAPPAAPCPNVARFGAGALPGPQERCSDIADVEAYDALIVAPGRDYSDLLADGAALDLVRRAFAAGLAVASFCHGVRVLAAAGVLAGRAVTGRADARAACEAAGARFVGYDDLSGKSDAPPPLVDGPFVTSVRSKYYRSAICDAIRVAAGNAARARGRAAAGGRASDGVGPTARAVGATRQAARSAMFAFMMGPGEADRAELLVGSLRSFGGALKGSSVACMVRGDASSVEPALRARLEALGCELVGFAPDPRIDGLPLAAKVGAAAAAERLAMGRADVLVWMDPDTVVAREPSELLLPAGAVAAASPVHHRLVGLPWGREPDDYWKAVYAAVGTDPEGAFPMLTVADREPVATYVNAGLVSARPGAGLFAAWRDGLAAACADQATLAAIAGNELRTLFLHQAALAAAVVATAGPSGFRELSYGYDYPLHMHAACPAALAPRKLDDLYTARYDDPRFAPGGPDCPVPVPERMRSALGRSEG